LPSSTPDKMRDKRGIEQIDLHKTSYCLIMFFFSNICLLDLERFS